MISVRHLSKTYVNPDGSKLQVLRDVNCDINPGEVICVIGPSGTGKSTFLRTLNMLETPSGGEIIFDGEDISGKGYPLDRMRRKIGMVFQHFNLFPHMTVLENVTYAPIKLLGLTKEKAEEEGLSFLRKVGMASKADVYPSTLSGGQQQRVAIARTLAMHPEVVLFDEPTSALDPTMVGEVLSVMRQLAKDGLTMIIVTHQMSFTRDVATRIFFMYDGVILEDGTPGQIFDHPVHSATKAFVRQIRKLVFEVEGDDFDLYHMRSEMSRFCIKYNITEKFPVAAALAEEFLGGVMSHLSPLTLRLTHGELDGVTALDFMVEGITESPLPKGFKASAGGVKEIVEEPTTRGFRVKVII